MIWVNIPITLEKYIMAINIDQMFQDLENANTKEEASRLWEALRPHVRKLAQGSEGKMIVTMAKKNEKLRNAKKTNTA
jgi:hypothetical protein